MKNNSFLMGILVLFLIGTAFGSGEETNLTDVIFKDDVVHSYELVFNVANWQAKLDSNKIINDEAYLEAKFIYRPPTGDSIILNPIGVRYKGNSSYTLAGTNPKKSFKLNFDEYVDSLTFFGCKKINLNNCIADPSYMREKIGYDIIRKYTPAPRVAYAKLSINGQLIGVYTQVEQVDKDFLERYFEKDGGSLFKACDGGSALDYKGPNKDSYTALYEIKENDDNPNAWTHFINTLYKLNDTLSGYNGIVNKTKEHLNFTNCIQHVAWTIVLSHFDSYTQSGRNFYMYDDPKTGQFFMIPWDVNMAFGQFTIKEDNITNNAFVPENMNNRPLLKVIMGNDSLKSVYVHWLLDMINGPASAENIAKEADRLKAIIEPAVKLEPDANRFYTYDQFIENIEKDIVIENVLEETTILGIKSFSVARNAELLKQIAAGIERRPAVVRKHSGLRLSCLSNIRGASVAINYSLAGTDDASVTIFNGSGKIIECFSPNTFERTGSVVWKTAHTPAGVYIVSLTGGLGSVSERVVLAK